jgi:hypothetical protein
MGGDARHYTLTLVFKRYIHPDAEAGYSFCEPALMRRSLHKEEWSLRNLLVKP